MAKSDKRELGPRAGRLVSMFDRMVGRASRHNVTISLALISCIVALAGVFVIRDLQTTNAEAENMYLVSVQGLRRIGELQFEAQETRRATLYALTTNDSNLQLVYADQSRDADQRVSDGVAEYRAHAKQPKEIDLAERLRRDWASYLPVRDEVLALILEGSTDEAVHLDLYQGVPSFERVRLDLNEVKRLYDEEASQRVTNVEATSHRSAVRLIGILGFAFVLSSVGIWAIQRSRMLSAIQLAKTQMEFVASVSHELRTPLAVLSSAADNLTDGVVEGEVELQKYGRVIQNQSRQMKGLVDEILLFASTEDRKSHHALQRLEVSQIIETLISSTRELVQGEGFVVESRVEPGIPPVMGEMSAISRCLQNLVGNAVKYSGNSKWIGLSAHTAPAEDGSGIEVRIEVSDRGIGIDRSEIEKVFDPFYRSPRINALQIHGTGLGLALAKRLAETMGGRLTVISELSAGSTFTLHLPAAEGEKLAMSRAPSSTESNE